MGQAVELVPLVCVRCNNPIPAEAEEVAWVCAQCGQGLRLDEEKGLVAQEICFADGLDPNVPGKPFWVADGQVTLQRQTFSSSGKDTQAAAQFWSAPRRFMIPAFAAPLEELLQIGTELIYKPPVLKEGPGAKFEPVTLQLEDVNAAADFLVVAIEAGRSDKLKSINFTLKLSPAVLWIIP